MAVEPIETFRYGRKFYITTLVVLPVVILGAWAAFLEFMANSGIRPSPEPIPQSEILLMWAYPAALIAVMYLVALVSQYSVYARFEVSLEPDYISWKLISGDVVRCSNADIHVREENRRGSIWYRLSDGVGESRVFGQNLPGFDRLSAELVAPAKADGHYYPNS